MVADASLRILLIDDDAISREVLAMILEMHDFQVVLAENGAHALTILEEDAQPALKVILMDSQMPGLSGLRLVKALRARTRARIVAISGSPVTASLLKATDGFLLKPIDAEALLDLLKSTDAADGGSTSSEAETVNSGASASVIDEAVLGKLKAMMPAKAVLEIYTAVAADLEVRLDSLEKAMTVGNSTEVKRIAHAIKGGCAMVGLIPAREAAARLETSNAPVTYPAELAQLRTALTGLKGILTNDFPL